MSTHVAADLRTTQPLWFPHQSTAPEHLERVVAGVVILGPSQGGGIPSKLATDMVLRITVLGGMPSAYGDAADPIVARALDEATAMLAGYIGRLEDLARKYGAHLKHCDRAP